MTTVDSPAVTSIPNDRVPGRVQSIERAVTILEFLARNGWSGVTEVGNELEVHKSTAFRMLSTLEGRGLVEQHVSSGQYHLGFGLVHLARAVRVGPDLARQIQPNCEWLAQKTSETVTLTVLEGEECVTIDQIISTSTVVSRSWLGRRTPLHCTSPGKVFLASLPASRCEEILSEVHEPFTEHTMVSPEALRDEVRRVRSLGYATTAEEFEEGLSAVAAPVRAADGTVVAAIGISGPTYRLDEAETARAVPLVREAAEQASVRFGYSHRASRG